SLVPALVSAPMITPAGMGWTTRGLAMHPDMPTSNPHSTVAISPATIFARLSIFPPCFDLFAVLWRRKRPPGPGLSRPSIPARHAHRLDRLAQRKRIRRNENMVLVFVIGVDCDERPLAEPFGIDDLRIDVGEDLEDRPDPQVVPVAGNAIADPPWPLEVFFE